MLLFQKITNLQFVTSFIFTSYVMARIGIFGTNVLTFDKREKLGSTTNALSDTTNFILFTRIRYLQYDERISDINNFSSNYIRPVKIYKRY